MGRLDVDIIGLLPIPALRIAGRKFEHGAHVYAPSKLQIALDGKFERFEALIGLDDWVNEPTASRAIRSRSAGLARYLKWAYAKVKHGCP